MRSMRGLGVRCGHCGGIDTDRLIYVVLAVLLLSVFAVAIWYARAPSGGVGTSSSGGQHHTGY
jgi:hypothetical protein